MYRFGIVIPVYNGEAFVRRAIESVISQTYKDWVLCIVDDCSTDNTYAICEEYANKYDNIILTRHEKNKGAGVARQTGNKILTDVEFIMYIDSDDYILPNFLEGCDALQRQHDSDIVYTSFTISYEKEGVNKVIPAGDFIMSESATVQLYYWNEIKFLVAKPIRRSLIDTISFSNRRVGEDCQTLYFLLYNSKRVRSSSFTGYVHVFRPGSLLADKPFFYCFCWSTLAQIDIIEFLKRKYYSLKPSDPLYKDTKRLLDFELGGIKKGYESVKKGIASGQISVGGEYKEWDRIQKWFNENNAILFGTARSENKRLFI